DQILDVQLTGLKEMGGPGGGTNHEQLFAAGYSACFLGAMKFVANRDKLNMSIAAYIESDVVFGPIPIGFVIHVNLNNQLEGMDQQEAQKLVDAAHIVCPYSNATRNNIDVNLNVIT